MKHITSIKIPALKGIKILANAKDTFSYIDSDFENYGANKKGKATKEMNLDVFEMTEDGTFSNFLSKDNLLTQEQILYFVENHKDLLCKNRYTFFPFKSGDEVFVADVDFDDGGPLKVLVYRFSNDVVWYAGFGHQIIIPQLDSKTPSLSDTQTLKRFDTSEVKEKLDDFIEALQKLRKTL